MRALIKSADLLQTKPQPAYHALQMRQSASVIPSWKLSYIRANVSIIKYGSLIG